MGKIFTSEKEEYNYYIQTFKNQYDQDFYKEMIDDILANYAKYKNLKKSIKFHLSSLREINQKLEENNKIINSSNSP